MNNDQITADAFAKSWNTVYSGPTYTEEQFIEWFKPLKATDIKNKTVLELGCGNASLMYYLADWQPKKLVGVDLGDSLLAGRKNMELKEFHNWQLIKGDLVNYISEGFDIVYSIGVLHHLQTPLDGIRSVVRNVKPGGKFHCWVYAKEGNFIIRFFVDPLRMISSKLPWWITKYFIATPLMSIFFVYSKILRLLPNFKLIEKLPLYKYAGWISQRSFKFYQHVAFDQLVTPQTVYIDKKTIEKWLNSFKEIEKDSLYIIFRNGNSWKFGGRLKKIHV